MTGLSEMVTGLETGNWEDGVAAPRGCDHPDCAAEGAYRAPRSPDTLTTYYWFCLDHVRQYNAAWNFFAGMSRNQIEAFQHADLTGHRPTWRLSGRASAAAIWNGAPLDDPFGLFGDGPADDGPAPQRVPANERDALAVLDLPSTAAVGDIKARYKELVKGLHPDVNGRDKAAEERLKAVIEAYRVLARRRGVARL